MSSARRSAVSRRGHATSDSKTASIEILGVWVATLDRSGALAAIDELVRRAEPATVSFVNAHSLNLAHRHDGYRRALRRSDLVLNDGAGLALAARILHRRFPANLNGTDLLPEILTYAAKKRWTVFLFGARPGIADAAAQRLMARTPDLNIVGTADGYSRPDDEIVKSIHSSDADIVLVALGNPRQELWLDRHIAASGARLGLGVGAFFDFSAGRVPRAPNWMRRASIEWVYRLAIEPQRMFRRYVVGNPMFVLRVLHQRVVRSTRGSAEPDAR